MIWFRDQWPLAEQPADYVAPTWQEQAALGNAVPRGSGIDAQAMAMNLSVVRCEPKRRWGFLWLVDGCRRVDYTQSLNTFTHLVCLRCERCGHIQMWFDV